MDGESGSLELSNEVVNAKYLLLRRKGEEFASDLYEITSKGPKVFSKSYLIDLDYPQSENLKEYYLAIDIKKVTDTEFKNVSWDFKRLEEYKKIQALKINPRTKIGLPFSITLTNLMRNKI